MTKGKKFKKRVRARVAETGESYSRARMIEGGSTRVWYYYRAEDPSKVVFPFHSRLEAEAHAGESRDEMTFAEREATDEEMRFIAFGRARYAFKFPPPNEDTATTDFVQAWHAWVAYATKLREWVDDLQSGMYVNCVYCGHHYGPQDQIPVSMASVLQEHIAVCPQHPLSKALRERDEARRMARAIRSEAGWEATWPLSWESD